LNVIKACVVLQLQANDKCLVNVIGYICLL